ncbi:MAG: V-type ATP synthase subunit D [Anaerolineaceae bacterium]|nr:V-type ATP synthase subunit D [Anaerolineaceae bacterium]
MKNVSNISTTRSELLLRKQQIELTQAGYDLLDKKRLALLQKILQLQEEAVRLATILQGFTDQSRRSYAKAEALIGRTGVSSAAMGNKHDVQLDLIDSQIMGVHVPRIKPHTALRTFHDRDICITGTSPVIDETAESFEKNIEGIINLADGEIQLAKLMKEILRTTRRLKALEHIIIPRLREEYAYIRMALEERERSQHFTLKLAKKLIDAKYARKKAKAAKPALS